MKPRQIVKHKRRLVMVSHGVYMGKPRRFNYVLTFRLTTWGYGEIYLHFDTSWEAVT